MKRGRKTIFTILAKTHLVSQPFYEVLGGGGVSSSNPKYLNRLAWALFVLLLSTFVFFQPIFPPPPPPTGGNSHSCGAIRG